MTGGHLIAELAEVLRAVASQDVGYFDHGRCPGKSILAHDVVDLLLDVRHGALRQMHIDECGGNALMAQQGLNHSQMDSGLHEMGGVGMP